MCSRYHLTSNRAMGLVLFHIKIRTYSRTREDRWFEEWTSPWKTEISVNDPAALLAEWHKPIEESSQ
jgi:proteasome activator subunit 4